MADFARLAKVPNEVGPDLLGLFQPTPKLKPLFSMLVAALKAKAGIGQGVGIFWAAVVGYWRNALIGAGVGFVSAALIAALLNGGSGLIAFGPFLAVVGLIVAVILRVIKALQSELPENDFGLCPGIQQPDAVTAGFTDWLAKLIDEAGGRGKDTDRPLTFGDLLTPSNGRPSIHLAMMTTSLWNAVPIHYRWKKIMALSSSKVSGRRFFPKRIMDFLIRECDPFKPLRGEKGSFFYFPDEDRLPDCRRGPNEPQLSWTNLGGAAVASRLYIYEP